MGVTIKKKHDRLNQMATRFMRSAERKALRGAAKVLQKEAKKEAPKITGELRRGMKVRAGKRSRLRQSVLLVSTVPYASKLEAMYQTIEKTANEIKQQMDDELARLLREEMNTL